MARILVCPTETDPHLLWAAMIHTCPTRILAICSLDTFLVARKVYNHAMTYFELLLSWKELVLRDPDNGFGELDGLVEEAKPWLAELELEVHVCLTGGTPLMRELAERLAQVARDQCRRYTRRFTLVDERPPHRKNWWQYVQGRQIYLDS